jgi:hypothetical protein
MVTADAADPGAISVVAAIRPLTGDPGWDSITGGIALENRGLAFVLEHPAESMVRAGADVIGVLLHGGQRRACMPDFAHAVSEAQHPSARMAGRRLAEEG